MSDMNLNKVPHLTTTLEGPLLQIEKHLLSNQIAIESWLRQQWLQTPPPIYCSVDLRNAGFKLAPVDTNLFPAGFNNLNPDFFSLCIQALQATLEQMCPTVKRILLIPEDHTRNIYYFENVATLQQIFIKAGFEIRIGSLLPELKKGKVITLPSGGHILLEPIIRQGNRISVDDFSPCLIVLNNDLSNGVPELLQHLEQTIMPPHYLGWYSRLKSKHFQYYEDISHEFGKTFAIDPWLISPLFRYCGEVDFLTREGENCLVYHAETLFASIREKYQEYGVEQNPFLVIKADAGTYGMAVMMIQKTDDLFHLNRKERTRMASIKGGRSVSRVIIQEGVYTSERWGKDQATAEPVVYMIGRHVVGGFYRVHAGRGNDENLNSPGMNFQPLAFAAPCNNPNIYSQQLGLPDEIVTGSHQKICEDSMRDYNANALQESCANRFYAYGVIARLALLAAARELKE
jgi:glutamate--cysteine ligase